MGAGDNGRTSVTIDYEGLRGRFSAYQPDEDAESCHEAVRDAGYAMTVKVLQVAPDSRERSLALTKIEEAVFWANAAIAREES